MDDEYTPDGYRIVKPMQMEKGIQCGLCGMRFDAGKAYGYACNKPECPIFMQITCRVSHDPR